MSHLKFHLYYFWRYKNAESQLLAASYWGEDHFLKAEASWENAWESYLILIFGKVILYLQVLWACDLKVCPISKRVEFQVIEGLFIIDSFAVPAMSQSLKALPIFIGSQCLLTSNFLEVRFKAAIIQNKVIKDYNWIELRWKHLKKFLGDEEQEGKVHFLVQSG